MELAKAFKEFFFFYRFKSLYVQVGIKSLKGVELTVYVIKNTDLTKDAVEKNRNQFLLLKSYSK